ncbi:endo-1,4-beta-xylanase [Draconibacterium mangrovi]|uniref:endo-1,4-beta-xylanase n=1 Tax=Draconibacterium mangrovi TaxID=2697469 RepID=UPI0013D1B33D|nr:endo-1,4-beta-xylanase [Draconibacterium mangrovi]
MKNNQKLKTTRLFLVFLLVVSQSAVIFGGGKKNKDIADEDLTIRQIIEKYYGNTNFNFGCISKAIYLKEDNPDVAFYLKEFSYNVPENEFKQSGVYPEPDSNWRDDNFLGLIEMARKSNQIMRAHAPISPQCSRWAMADDRTPEELQAVMEDYMDHVSKAIEANRDIIGWMDVVNETVTEGNIYDSVYHYKTGDWYGPLVGDRRWQNPWTTIGYEFDSELNVPTYIIRAFEIANENAPNVKMLYNHHGQLEEKAWDKIKQTVLYLRNRGLRVDAIGWQAHVPVGFENVNGKMEQLNELIDWCYQNDLEFHVTEIDVNVGKNVDDSIFVQKEKEIADTYAAITETMLKKIGKGAVTINCWALKHRRRRIEGSFAGLFDDERKPTQAYYRIKKVLLENAPNRQ